MLVVSEGKHELGTNEVRGALLVLVDRPLSRPVDFETDQIKNPRVRVHKGKGHRYWKRALAWIEHAQRHGFDALVLVIDQDGDDQRQQQLTRAQDDDHFDLPCALGVAIRAFDAWVLADETALTAALGHTVPTQPDPELMCPFRESH